MRLTSPAFEEGGQLASRSARHEDELSPPLQFHDLPGNTASLLLVMEDLDSPLGCFTHWLLFNIAPTVSAIEEGSVPHRCEVGLNGFGTLGYAGPCPPTGRHRYRFRLCALVEQLDATEGARKDQILRDMAGLVVAEAALTGSFDATR